MEGIEMFSDRWWRWFKKRKNGETEMLKENGAQYKNLKIFWIILLLFLYSGRFSIKFVHFVETNKGLLKNKPV